MRNGAAIGAGCRRAFLGTYNVVSPASTRPERFAHDYYSALLTRSGVTNATEPLVEAITRAYAI
jgi:hypothetical protein